MRGVFVRRLCQLGQRNGPPAPEPQKSARNENLPRAPFCSPFVPVLFPFCSRSPNPDRPGWPPPPADRCLPPAKALAHQSQSHRSNAPSGLCRAPMPSYAQPPPHDLAWPGVWVRNWNRSCSVLALFSICSLFGGGRPSPPPVQRHNPTPLNWVTLKISKGYRPPS